jgi:ABC-2 type transport system ATP-binding protein
LTADQALAPISIQVKGVRKNFGKLAALSGVTLGFADSTMHGVIGPEGAGKTTLLRVMLGLLKASEGSVEYIRGGEPVDFEKIRPSVAYMPQQQSLYPDLSIGEHLDFFKDLYGISDTHYKQRR